MYKHLTSEQRYTISTLLANNFSLTYISKIIGVSVSTVSRELKRNSSKRGYSYRLAHEYAKIRMERTCNHRIKAPIRKRAIELLSSKQYSPEQISGVFRLQGVTLSHETIYKWIRADKAAGGSLYLHCRHRLKHKKRIVGTAPYIRDRVSIHERPPQADGSRFGDWEMDTIVGQTGKEVIVTLVERRTNYMLMQRLPAGKQAKGLADTVIRMLFPFRQYVHTITTDNGCEFAEHKTIAKHLKTTVYFADPYASWQKGCIENTNKLVRQYIQKGMSFNRFTDREIADIQQKLNQRPRRKLNFISPIIAFQKYLC